jgi:uncharacterized protein (TIGR03067 family)
MRYALAWTAVWLLAVTGHAQNTDPLAGTWVVVATTNGGQDDSQLRDHTATFADGKLTFKSKDGKVHTATYTLDASKKPATLDLVPADGPHQGKTLKAIYVIDKNGELKLCVGKEGEDRPTAFSSKAGEQTVLLSLKKADAGKPPDNPPPLRVLDHCGLFRPAALSSGGFGDAPPSPKERSGTSPCASTLRPAPSLLFPGPRELRHCWERPLGFRGATQ